ncbi:MAG: hypothetical protein JWN26_797 [Candidatus Saccharibacteria bacterium]|nr:hypothetical protein [Candidatus Saccharibacteria bacterium]
MSPENEQAPSAAFRLQDASAEKLIEIAYGRKTLLDVEALARIITILKERFDSLDHESPELQDTEVALGQIHNMYLEMTDGAPEEGEALKNKP